MNNFEMIESNELEQINGGGLAGAFVGGIFGTGAGMLAGCVTVIVTGNSKDGGHIIWQTTKKGAVGGTWAGLMSPM